MRKIYDWYDEGSFPSIGVISFNKDVDKCIGCLLEYQLVDCKWFNAELNIAVDCIKTFLKVSPSDTHVHNAILNYLVRFVNHFVTLTDIRQIAAVCSGWKSEFKNGQLFEPWNGTTPVWAALYVDTVKHTTDYGYFDVDMVAIAGPASGMSIPKRVDRNSANMLFRELIGYKSDPLETPPSVLFLGGLYFIALMQSINKRVSITQAFATPAMRKFNKDLMEMRASMCIGGFVTENICTPYCPKQRNECILSTHADKRHVHVCKNLVIRHEGWIMKDGYCSKCLREGLAVPNENEERIEE